MIGQKNNQLLQFAEKYGSAQKVGQRRLQTCLSTVQETKRETLIPCGTEAVQTLHVAPGGTCLYSATTIETREGHRWKPGQNVNGTNHLTAAIDGEVYFTKSKNRFRKVVTVINVRPVEEKKSK